MVIVLLCGGGRRAVATRPACYWVRSVWSVCDELDWRRGRVNTRAAPVILRDVRITSMVAAPRAAPMRAG